jgi:Domain of unknown function (DUF5658)
MKRIAAAMILTLGVSSLPASAAETRDAETAPAVAAADQTLPAPVVARRAPVKLDWYEAHSRPMALAPLYASFASLQAFDVYSTQRALSNGAHEANPMMKTVVGNPAVFWTVKAAATVAPMMAAERLWKTNRVAAIAVMVASNGVMAAVAAHNASVIKQLR